MRHQALLLVLLLFAARPCGVAAETIDSIARIRALTPAEAAGSLPVSIEVIVTFYNPPSPGLLAHDGRGGIFLDLEDTPAESRSFTPGTRLRIEGVTEPGGFMPIVRVHRATTLGQAPLPEPQVIAGSELFSPSLDCQWVEVPAVITGAEGSGESVLIAEISGWTVKVIMPRDKHMFERAAAIMQRPVAIRGVVGSVFNAQRQLTARHFFVPSFEQIVPIETAQADEEPQLRKINELLRSDATLRSRVRIQGTVTYAAKDGLYLRGEGGSVLVRRADPNEFAPGTRVEAEGYAAIAPFRPILRATRVTPLDTTTLAPQPEPLLLTSEKIVSQQAELVQVEADFLTRRDGPGQEVVLQCRADRWFFEALLTDGAALPQKLTLNDRIRLTGICELTTTHALPFSSAVDGFRLHLRNVGDIAILRRAPWWTLRRLIWALGLIGILSLGTLVWAALLRRRVADQTEIIGAQIERAAVKDERQRIARELHDTIEQELAGLSVQLRNARQRLAHAPEQAGTALELAERMLRHCRNEARTSIRDLRSVALEQRGLHGALDELLSPMAAEGGAKFTLEVQGTPRNLAGPVEIHLLRIAQQAVANAMQHAAPGEIRAQLTYANDSVTLEVRDDGRGFDPNAPAPRGHFGILGIRERADKIHAALTIESAAGAGTTIRVTVPPEAAFRSQEQST